MWRRSGKGEKEFHKPEEGNGKKIVRLILDSIPDDGNSTQIDCCDMKWYEKLRNLGIDDIIGFIRIYRKDRSPNRNHWVSLSAGCLPYLLSELQRIVKDKEPKIERYLEKCDKVWLIISAIGFPISRVLCFNAEELDKAKNEMGETKFDRVIVYDRPGRRHYVISEIGTRYSGTA